MARAHLALKPGARTHPGAPPPPCSRLAAGHAGYEIAPFVPTIQGLLAAAVTRLRGSRAMNTVQHHDLHHRFPTRNFSLYFTHWDRLCGTLHEKYDQELFSYFG